MYLVNELAKNYLKSLFFNFLNSFFVIGAHFGGYHGNKFEFLSIIFYNMKYFSKYYKKVSNSESLYFIVIKHELIECQEAIIA